MCYHYYDCNCLCLITEFFTDDDNFEFSPYEIKLKVFSNESFMWNSLLFSFSGFSSYGNIRRDALVIPHVTNKMGSKQQLKF